MLMIRAAPPRGGLRVWLLAAWSLAIALAWLLLGQQLDGQPVLHLDLTAELSGAQPCTGSRPRRGAQYPLAPAGARTASADLNAILNTILAAALNGGLTATAALNGDLPQNLQAAARAVAFALAQQGKCYVFGAEGPDAYGCSGLTWPACPGAHERRRAVAMAPPAWPGRARQAAALLRRLALLRQRPQRPASIHHVPMHVGHGRMVEGYTRLPGPRGCGALGRPLRCRPARPWPCSSLAVDRTRLVQL